MSERRIKNLLSEVDRLKQERDAWKDEYHNLCKFANDLEVKLVEATIKIEELYEANHG